MAIDVIALRAAQANLAAMDAAIASGGAYNSITIDGQQVTFTSLNQMIAGREYWLRKIALISGTRRRATSINLTGF